MVEEKLNKIEEKIRHSENLPEENKAALFSLLNDLRSELGTTACEVKSDFREQIKEIDHKDEGLIKTAFDDLNQKITGFEESHPKLVRLVNAICTQLSNSGL